MSTTPAFKPGDKVRLTGTYTFLKLDTNDNTVHVDFGNGFTAWAPPGDLEIVQPTLTEQYEALSPGTRFTFGEEVQYTKIDDSWLVMHYDHADDAPAMRSWSDYSQATSATIEVVS